MGRLFNLFLLRSSAIRLGICWNRLGWISELILRQAEAIQLAVRQHCVRVQDVQLVPRQVKVHEADHAWGEVNVVKVVVARLQLLQVLQRAGQLRWKVGQLVEAEAEGEQVVQVRGEAGWESRCHKMAP